MKRSEIEKAIEEAQSLAEECGFHLPAFARWSLREWANPKMGPTMERGMGWDVTDFGRGDFARFGLTAFTLRNGSVAERDSGTGQTYAEKIMMARVGQETPFHLHDVKTEDIINRGGGVLKAELYPVAVKAGKPELGSGSIRTFVAGIQVEVEAGQTLLLKPGDWVQVPRGTLHRFWAVDKPVLVGEVSSVNDDGSDNTFLDPGERYPEVEEDVPARHLLVGEYGAAVGRLGGLAVHWPERQIARLAGVSRGTSCYG
jgi:D-lyxose ketol-isomerase